MISMEEPVLYISNEKQASVNKSVKVTRENFLLMDKMLSTHLDKYKRSHSTSPRPIKQRSQDFRVDSFGNVCPSRRFNDKINKTVDKIKALEYQITGLQVNLRVLHNKFHLLEKRTNNRGICSNKGNGFLQNHKICDAGVIPEWNRKMDLNQYIEEKNKSSGLFRWNRILFILTILVIGWDIKRHKSFQASTIGRTIDNLGLTLYFETLGRSFRKGLLQAIRWSEENLPVYYSKGCELVGPYLILFQEKSIVALQYIYELLVTLSNNAAQYIPIVSKKIEEVFPGYPQIMEDFSNKCLQVSVQGWKVVCENVGPIIIQIQEYFSTKIFVGPLEPTILYSHLINGSNYMLESSVKLYTSFVKILQD